MKRINFLLTTLAFFLWSNLSFAQQSDLRIYGFLDMEAEVNNKDAAGKY